MNDETKEEVVTPILDQLRAQLPASEIEAGLALGATKSLERLLAELPLVAEPAV